MDGVWAAKERGVGLIVRAICFQDFQRMWSRSTNVTDGQTDGRTTCDRNTALCTIVHRAVKCYYGLPIGTHQRTLEWCHPRPPTASSSQDWGFATPIQNSLQSLLSHRMKLRTSNLAGIGPIHRIHHPSIQKPIKNFGEKGAWAYPGITQVFGYPIILS